MIKAFGAMLIGSTVLILCYRPVYQKKQRIQLLFSLIQFLKCIHQELRTNLSSITELLELLCDHSEQPLKSMIIDVAREVRNDGAAAFKDSWKHYLLQYRDLLHWNELTQICCLGDVLGRYILEEQITTIESLIQTLEVSYHSELSQCKSYENFRVRLGVIIGAGIVIFLL